MNLLPGYQKKEIEKEIKIRLFFVAGGIFLFCIFIFMALMYNSILFLDLQIPTIEKRLEVEQNTQKSSVFKGVEEEINMLNDVLIKIEKIRQKDSYNFPYILRVIGTIVPGGAELGSITFNNGSMSIFGHADERSQVLELKRRLEGEEIFKNVNSPLSNIVKERDINFSFTFLIDGK